MPKGVEEKKVSCGAGQYWKRRNKKGMVYAYAARKQWVPKNYWSGTCKTKAEVESLLKRLERDYRDREFGTAAGYFSPEELENAYRRFRDFEDEHEDFKNDRPSLSDLVAEGLQQWKWNPHLRAKLRGATYTVATAYDVFFKERRAVIEETISEDKKFLRGVLKPFWSGSIFFLFDPPKQGDAPTDSIRIRMRNHIRSMRRNDGNEYSEVTKLKRAKTLKHFFKVVRRYFNISDPNPVEDLPSEFHYKRIKTPETADISKIEKMFTILRDEKQFQKLIPFASMFFFSGRRPSEMQKHRKGIGKITADYSYFNGFDTPSILGNKKGRRFILPAEIYSESGQKARGTKLGREEAAELSESGFLWIKFYFEDLLGGELPTRGAVFYSRALWDQLRLRSGWVITNGSVSKDRWVPDVARHTFNTAAILYWPEQTAFIHELAGHSTDTFKAFYKNPVMTGEEARRFFEDIVPSGL